MENNEQFNCEDKPIITFCSKCGRIYGINQDTGDRTELDLTLQQLINFIELIESIEK